MINTKKRGGIKKIFDMDDDNEHHHKSPKKYGKKYLSPVNNPTYEEECGACHFFYQPELLLSGSWEKIVARLDDHYGQEIEIDYGVKKCHTKISHCEFGRKIFRQKSYQDCEKLGELDAPSNYQNSLCSGKAR